MIKFFGVNITFCIGLFWLMQAAKMEDVAACIFVGCLHIYLSWKLYELKP